MNFNPEIFKVYDIRGEYGKDFTDDFAFKLGKAVVKHLRGQDKKWLVGHDDRDFSVPLARAVINGITSAGGRIEYIGLGTTPFFNFVFHQEKCYGGIMVTASHNTANIGGFKIF